jgi:hypothetical protein
VTNTDAAIIFDDEILRILLVVLSCSIPNRRMM